VAHQQTNENVTQVANLLLFQVNNLGYIYTGVIMAKRSRRSRNRQTGNTEEDFRQEYAYVLNDLKRVLILAGFMFTLLIILNLVLPYLGV
jgi:hypothetical protein